MNGTAGIGLGAGEPRRGLGTGERGLQGPRQGYPSERLLPRRLDLMGGGSAREGGFGCRVWPAGTQREE